VEVSYETALLIRQYLSHICGEFLGIGETSEAIERDVRDTKRALKRSFIPQKAFGAITGRLWLWTYF